MVEQIKRPDDGEHGINKVIQSDKKICIYLEIKSEYTECMAIGMSPTIQCPW